MNTTRMFTMKRTTQIGLLAGMMLLGTAVIAQDAPNTALQPDQRAQIQSIGQSVIKAMRTAEPAPERDAVAAQIQAIKQQVNLMATLDSSSSLTLQGQRASKSLSVQSQTNVNGAMDTLRTRLDTLKAQTQKLRDQQQAQTPTLWQQVTGFLGQSSSQSVAQRPIVKPLSTASIIALDNLDTEVQAALALPPKARREKFEALSQKLTLNKKPMATPKDSTVSSAITMDGEAFTVSSKETPTLQMRTQHRRNFSSNN